MKKLTIFIPVYNQEVLILRALKSIPKRDDINVLIIDDCSTDRTLQACQEWKQKNPDMEIQIKSLEENKGLGYVKNIAYKEATGEYIHELDADDFLNTKEYEKVIEQLDGTDMVYCNLIVNDNSVFKLTPETQKNYCSGIARFIRKEFIGNTKCPELRATQDLYFNQKLQRKKHTDKFTDINAYFYNFPREGSLYDQYKKGKIKVEVDPNDL